jgi:GNAT superfamily N-acetyltransferase
LKLTLDRLQEYVALTKADKTEKERQKAIEELDRDFKSGKCDLEDCRVMKDSESQLMASIRLYPLGQGASILTQLVTRKGIPDEDRNRATSLIAEAVDRAQISGCRTIETRIDVLAFFDAYRLALINTGFVHKGDRIEFKYPVEKLPDDEGNPIQWQPMDRVGFEKAAHLLYEVSQGQPDADPNEDPVEALKRYLSEPGLTNTPACVHVGFFNGNPAAFVMAQVNRATGWSRITHMGLVPAFRSQGLGKWVHRHGFAMIRAQGGTLYHGGCSQENTVMISLFNRHGCKEVEKMHEWEWKAKQ